MHTHSTLKIVVFLTVGVITLFTTALLAKAQDAVKIGFTYPETGAYSDEGRDERRGAEMAAEEINDGGGILGQQIELIFRDSQSDIGKGRENATKFIREDSVKMIFGEASSDVSIAVAEVAHENNTIFFATSAASMDVTGKNGYVTTFRGGADAWMAARVLGGFLLENYNSKKYYYVYADYNWGWTTEAAMRYVSDTTDVDIHKRSKVAKKASDSDIKAAIVEAARAEPDILVLILYGDQFVKAINYANELGLNISNDVQIVVPSLTLTMAEAVGPSIMEGVIGTSYWEWSIPQLIDSEPGMRFVERFASQYKRYPSSLAASAYTILWEYKAAVERARTFDTDKVISELEGWKYRRLKDDQEWRKFDHQSIQSMFLLRGRPEDEVNSDRFNLDYFKILRKVDGDEIAIPQPEWIWERLLNGKSPKLD